MCEADLTKALSFLTMSLHKTDEPNIKNQLENCIQVITQLNSNCVELEKLLYLAATNDVDWGN